MALTQCGECGHKISKSATQCPNCGAKIRRTSLFTKIVGGFFALVVLSMVVNHVDRSTNTATTAAPAQAVAPPVQAPPAPQTPEQRAAAERARADAERYERLMEGQLWTYNESAEPMGRGTVKHAHVRSLNRVEFDSPYSGAQRATLSLRRHPKWGRDVILRIERGQFLCRIDGCTVAVKFDDGKPTTYAASEPEDHSSTVLFIRNHDRFVAGAKKAKRAYIEAQFFREGVRVFEFDVSGLEW